jgi:glutathione S-transferase
MILPQSAAFLTLAKTLSGKLAFAEVTAALDSLDDHLAYRTFLVGHAVTTADAAVWGSLRGADMYSAPRTSVPTRRQYFVLICREFTSDRNFEEKFTPASTAMVFPL